MKVALLDGYNLIYRARYSFNKGEYGTSFSFFRSLRPLVEKLDADLVYFVTEGYPRERFELYSEYKANRTHHNDDNFQEQKKQIINLLKSYFPLFVSRHPFHEGDDVIANLIKYRHSNDECVVVSTDTDFLQLYNCFKNVTIYNPIRKQDMEKPLFNYVQWKALRGDSSDNIKGIRGIGDKRAKNLIADQEILNDFLSKDSSHKKIFEMNLKLITFADLKNEMDNIEISTPIIDWSKIKNIFDEFEFKAITNSKSWIKYQETFSKLEKNINMGDCSWKTH